MPADSTWRRTIRIMFRDRGNFDRSRAYLRSDYSLRQRCSAATFGIELPPRTGKTSTSVSNPVTVPMRSSSKGLGTLVLDQEPEKPKFVEKDKFTPNSASWEGRFARSMTILDLFAVVVPIQIVLNLIELPDWLDLTAGLLTAACLLAAAGLTRALSYFTVINDTGKPFLFARTLFAVAAGAPFLPLITSMSGVAAWLLSLEALLAHTLRKLLQSLLNTSRAEGRCMLPVLAVGNGATLRDLIERVEQTPKHGWSIEAVCTPDRKGTIDTRVSKVPIVGDYSKIDNQVRRGGYRIVAITPDSYWGTKQLSELASRLATSGADMLLISSMPEFCIARPEPSNKLGVQILRVDAPSQFRKLRRIIRNILG
jgi:hypothetical protein